MLAGGTTWCDTSPRPGASRSSSEQQSAAPADEDAFDALGVERGGEEPLLHAAQGLGPQVVTGAGDAEAEELMRALAGPGLGRGVFEREVAMLGQPIGNRVPPGEERVEAVGKADEVVHVAEIARQGDLALAVMVEPVQGPVPPPLAGEVADRQTVRPGLRPDRIEPEEAAYTRLPIEVPARGQDLVEQSQHALVADFRGKGSTQALVIDVGEETADIEPKGVSKTPLEFEEAQDC